MRRPGVVRGVFAGLFLASALPLFAQTSPAGQGAVSVRTRPANADVVIDGERWVTPENEGVLTVQLLPGQHRIDVRAPGYRTFSTVVTVRPGETLPVNVSLSPGTDAPEPAPPPNPKVPSPASIVQVPSAEDGFAIAPDFRITQLNHQTTQFVGAYGGVVFAGQALFGLGGYFQADSPSDIDRKSTRLNSSHLGISYAVFCLKKKKKTTKTKKGRYTATKTESAKREITPTSATGMIRVQTAPI